MSTKIRLTTTVTRISLCLMISILALLPLHASAIGPVEVVATYDPLANELPEGIAIDKQGNIYVSLASLGQLRKIAPDGTQSTVMTLDPEGGIGMLGLAVDAPGNIYATLASTNPDTNGVHRVHPSGSNERLHGTGAILLPNGLVFDQRGNLYVTDSILGAIWRVPRDGQAAIWLQDPLLVGTGEFGFGVPIGANGIVYRQNTLYIANSEKGWIVRIAVNPDGSAGMAEILIADPGMLIGVDGLALDVHGNIFATNVVSDLLVRIAIDAAPPAITLLATADDGLDGPASLAFGTGKGERQSLFITNFALLRGENPALLKANAGVPGLPLP